MGQRCVMLVLFGQRLTGQDQQHVNGRFVFLGNKDCARLGQSILGCCGGTKSDLGISQAELRFTQASRMRMFGSNLDGFRAHGVRFVRRTGIGMQEAQLDVIGGQCFPILSIPHAQEGSVEIVFCLCEIPQPSEAHRNAEHQRFNLMVDAGNAICSARAGNRSWFCPVRRA